MAVKSHIEILKKGRAAWNEWRAESIRVVPDLSYTELINGNFIGFDFSRCNFRGTNASKSDFSITNLKDSDLSNSILNQCNFHGADCQGANFLFSDMSEASLINSRLVETNFNGAFLGNADLSGAFLWQTNLGAVVLTGAKGLNTCRHGGPSIIDHRTVKTMLRSGSYDRDFLAKCGIPERLIDYMPSSIEKPIEYLSCFISYSHKDYQFAKNLYDALTSHGVSCWFDEHEMVGGQSMYKKVDEGINLKEKTILCCSESSLSQSWWVNREIDKALIKEEKLWKQNNSEQLVIIPVALDDFLFSWDGEKASFLTSRYALDFSGWENDRSKFRTQVKKVLVALSNG